MGSYAEEVAARAVQSLHAFFVSSLARDPAASLEQAVHEESYHSTLDGLNSRAHPNLRQLGT